MVGLIPGYPGVQAGAETVLTFAEVVELAGIAPTGAGGLTVSPEAGVHLASYGWREMPPRSPGRPQAVHTRGRRHPRRPERSPPRGRRVTLTSGPPWPARACLRSAGRRRFPQHRAAPRAPAAAVGVWRRRRAGRSKDPLRALALRRNASSRLSSFVRHEAALARGGGGLSGAGRAASAPPPSRYRRCRARSQSRGSGRPR